ncbi:MAG: alpha-amylase family glycosyl hydrolase [Opitutae bacterium]
MRPRTLLPLLGLTLLASVHAAPAAESAPARYQPVPYVKLTHPEWSKNATIYQINTRQFTAEGTFRAAEAHLPRLKALNVDILWLMPINPIGEKNRKGTLGSPYSVRDYLGVNPEFGTLADLKHFVAAAHAQGFKVILDWVANHTAWDNPLAAQHPEWYQHDWKGAFRPTPWWDWSDIINLDYRQPGLRKYMTDAMKYWVQEADIDGYRCDVAGFVPVDFWNNVRRELDAIKPVFMLAEWESRDLHAEAFDMTYGWTWYEGMSKIAAGKADLGTLFTYYSWNESSFPPDCYRMLGVSNHDKNSWEGTGPEAFGGALEAAIVLSVVSDGLPLLYNSQEAGETKRLKFFEKDPIEWRAHPHGELYRQLFALKHANTALWNGHWGALMVQVPNNHRTEVLSFVRGNEHDRVFAVFNFSQKARTVRFEERLGDGTYTDYFSGEQVTINDATQLNLAPWAYRVFVQAPR